MNLEKTVKWAFFVLGVAVGVFFYQAAKATENKAQTPSISTSTSTPVSQTVTASPTAGGGGGGGGGGGANTFAFGSSASANAATCYFPVLAGLGQMEDSACVAIRQASALEALGMRAAAIYRLCQDERVAAAMKKAGIDCE